MTSEAGLELAVRLILRLFSTGQLVYRKREQRVAGVSGPSARLRKLRRKT